MKLQKHLIKKKTYKKVIPFVMAGAMLAQTATPVLAAQSESQDVGYDEASAGTQKDAVVKAVKDSEFTVTLPKTIILDSNDAADYTVKVKGSVLPDESVSVAPHDDMDTVDGINFTMQELAGKKADAVATAVQDDTMWASAEITAEGTEKPGNITAEGITAGSWEGNLTFDINMDGSGSGGTGGETGGETGKEDINTLLGAVTISSSNADGNVVNPGDVLSVNTEKTEDVGDLSYKWFIDGEEIADETGNSYTVKDSDIGKTISAEVRSSLSDGVAKTDFKAAVTEVKADISTLLGNVTISSSNADGDVVNPGDVLSVVTEKMEGTGDLSYKWFADGEEIADETGNSYTVKDSDAGKTISAEVRSSLSDGVAVASFVSQVTEEEIEVAPVSEITNWKYTLDEENKTVTLQKYTGSQESVIVYGKYNVDGVEYATKINSASASPDNNYMFFNNKNVKSIKFNKGIDTNNCTSMSGMFSYCPALTSLDITNLNTGNVTDMSYMFQGCTSLKSLDVSNLDTSNVTNMYYMLGDCVALTSLDLSNWDTGSVTNMSTMFFNAHALTSLNLSNWDTKNVTNMKMMFNSCNVLTSLDLSSFDTSNVTDMGYMFDNCASLASIDLSSFDTSKVANMAEMFKDCTSLTSLDLYNFDTTKVSCMTRMFNNCTYLTTIYVNKDKWKVPDMAIDMFLKCGTRSVTYKE